MTDQEKSLNQLYQKDIARKDWCPGCGDFGVLKALQKALVELTIPPHQVVCVTGIGCSGQIGGYINCNVIKADHGRILPLAHGIKMANKDLCVLGVGGDGDGVSIGMEHFMLTPRTNIDITYLILDNQRYSLTTGQTSPTTPQGTKTLSHPKGVTDEPVNPIVAALAAGATFIARTFAGHVNQSVEIIKAAITHCGFAFINDFSPCPTFNKINTHDWFKEKVFYLKDKYPDYDTKDKIQAYTHAEKKDEFALGIFYQVEKPITEPDKPLVDLELEGIDYNDLLEQFM
ncbi:thiamine pyrophosphate-dependent enzyme [Patescibacteria group bacterium AH-259-L05]|nr:thiamine pyrophosphate-dependent enzyme [Patescibacteria group bacterium AH-259-L05]